MTSTAILVAKVKKFNGRGTRYALFISSLLLTFVSCGGGGGGGNGSGGTLVLHSSIDEGPIDVFLADGSEAVTTTRFLADEGRVDLGEGPQSVTLKRRGGVFISSPSTILGSGHTLVHLFGARENGSIGAKFLEAPEPSLEGGQAGLRVIHGVYKASEIAVSLNGERIPAIGFGSGSEFVRVSSSSVKVRVLRVADRSILLDQTVEVEAGGLFSLLVAGEADYFVRSRLYRD